MSSGKSTLTPYVSSYLNTQNDVPPTSQQSNRLRYPVILPKSAPSGTYTQQHIQNTGPTPTPAIGVPGNKNQYYSVKPGSFPGESVMTPTNKLGTTKTSRNPQPTQNVHDIRPEVHHFCASSEISDTMLPATRENLDITQAPYVKGTVWNEQPFYLLLTKTSIPAGGKTQYEEPAPTGFGGVNDFTSFVYGQAGMTKDFLPTYMYMLEPPDEFKAYCEWRKKNTKAKVDHMGVTMYERWPAEGTAARPLLDIAGLPDQVNIPQV
ncbi:uncharacterized protein KY384_003876 [Bacidia gigantensis]|uniref:uncharacterized protein n=1 Tax=Bacidia gigantensis TaxID=2732470 RepID=UPI001D03CDDA|nr:uncharacterized protein KY384_003876 [Bacidia gigantensis]KAG8532235.1 hypothetical protein KY384_003876 [Bacidia gigantensis]